MSNFFPLSFNSDRLMPYHFGYGFAKFTFKKLII